MQESSLSIERIDHINQDEFWALLDRFTFPVDRDYYERSIEHHVQGKRILFLARFDGAYVGFCFLNWAPKYAYFKSENIPEIQDLNVLREYRERGIGTSIIKHCEDVVREKGYEQIGIGVGMDNSFGAAQRLYVKMGYVPDGYGVTYDRKAVATGEMRPIDDNLSLMMTKSLG